MVPAMEEERPETEAESQAESQLPPPAKRKPRIAILLTFLGVFVALLIVFREVLFPFLMAIYIAYLVEPIVRYTTKSRLFGIKWTRGPTIVTIYVLVLGGMSILGWIGLTKLAKTIRYTASDVKESLQEEGHRATFKMDVTVAAEANEATRKMLRRPVVVPKGTQLELASGLHETLHAVRLAAEDPIKSVLLQPIGPHDDELEGDKALLKDPTELTYDDGNSVPLVHLDRVRISAADAGTGLEYFFERRLISPIVENLSKVGYEMEPDLVREFVRLKAEAMREDMPEQVGKVAFSVAGKLVLSIYMFFLILMLTAFIVMDRKGIAKFFASLPPPKYQSAYQSLIGYVDDGLAGVIRGQLVICAVNGVLTYIGLVILGIPYALLLASVAAVLSLIPVFGTIVSSIPIVLIGLTDGIDKGILALAWIVFIHVIEANMLNPVIMGSHARMHPVIIIFALLAGEHSFGIWGALLAVPTMSIIQSCFRFYLHKVEGLPKEPDNGHGEWLGHFWRKIKGWFSKNKPASEGASS